MFWWLAGITFMSGSLRYNNKPWPGSTRLSELIILYKVTWKLQHYWHKCTQNHLKQFHSLFSIKWIRLNMIWKSEISLNMNEFTLQRDHLCNLSFDLAKNLSKTILTWDSTIPVNHYSVMNLSLQFSTIKFKIWCLTSNCHIQYKSICLNSIYIVTLTNYVIKY
jgi:hypothetical protein